METIPKREDPPTTVSHLVYSHYPADMFTYPNNCHDSLVYVMPSDSNETLNGETMTKNTGSRWREDETEALVEIWRDKICQVGVYVYVCVCVCVCVCMCSVCV